MKVVRERELAQAVVVTNGLPGCGKTLMAPIISSFPRVELMRYNFHLEFALQLVHLGLLGAETAWALIRTQTDVDLYHAMMSREANFRLTDLSSVFRSARPMRYLMRALRPGDEAVVERIRTERPMLHLATHMIFGISRPLFDALGDRLRFVEVVRHPLYMIKQWRIWMPRADEDPRFFFLRIQHDGRQIPWFAYGWEEAYLRANFMDRAIRAIDRHFRLAEQAWEALSETERSWALIVPFERFVVDPQPWIARLEALLGVQADRTTRRMMRRQRVPRKRYAEGVGLKVYRKYGWQPPSPGADEQQEFAKRRAYVAAEASEEAMAVLDRLSQEYEAEYLPSAAGDARSAEGAGAEPAMVQAR